MSYGKKIEQAVEMSQLAEELECLRMRVQALEAENRLLRQAEKKLKESEEKYRTIFENTGTATILIEEDMTILMANTEFEKFSGQSRERIEGRVSWADFIADEDLSRLQAYHRDRRQQSHAAPRNYECRLVDCRRRIRNCFVTEALIPGTLQSVASFMDITETMEARKALRDSEEKFSKAFRSSPDSIMISTLSEGRFLDVNDTFCKVTGHTRQQTIGHTADELNFWPQPACRKNFINLLLKQGKIQNREVRFRACTGEVKTGLMSAEILDLQGEVCMLSAIIDITRQRRLEKEILKISELERRKIGHDLHDDLGQHLVGIMALSTLLEQRLENKSGSEKMLSKEISSLIKDAVGKTRNLARGLCPVKIEEDGLIPALQEFALYVKRVYSVFCIFDYDRSIIIKENRTATHLYHIVQEAINNAIRHGKARQILISLNSKDDYIVLSVKDNGRGFSKEPDPKKGLGLNIMKYRAKRIGATLQVKRKIEGGTNVLCMLNRKFLS